MPAQRKYPEELRERSVKMVLSESTVSASSRRSSATLTHPIRLGGSGLIPPA